MRARRTIVALTLACLAAAPATNPTATKPAISTAKPAPPPKPPDPAIETRALVVEIAQRKDAARRAAALARVTAMLDGEPRDALIAINALRGVGEIKFDRAPFADALRRLCRASPADDVRAAALAALPANGGGPRDLDLIAAACADDPAPRVRGAAINAFVAANENNGGVTFDALALDLLDDADPNVRVETLRAMQNVAVAPAVEARVIALSRDPKFSRDALILGLTTRPLVRRPVAERLAEAVVDPTLANLAERCAWGLRGEVAPDARPVVDAALLKLLDESIETNVRVNCVNALARSPDLDVLDRLATLSTDADDVDRVRDAARRALNLGQ